VYEILTPESDEQIVSCFGAFKSLRPHLESEKTFLAQVRRQQGQGYRVLALCIDDQVVSAAGFRIGDFLAWGRILYIDDLTTIPQARGNGYAEQLMDRLIEEAKANGCNAVHLDTGYMRHVAHRLYLRKGFQISSHHMSLALDSNV